MNKLCRVLLGIDVQMKDDIFKKNCLNLFFCPNYEIFSSTILLKEFHWLNFSSQWFLPFVSTLFKIISLKNWLSQKRCTPIFIQNPIFKLGIDCICTVSLKFFISNGRPVFCFFRNEKKGPWPERLIGFLIDSRKNGFLSK